jgi:periplasmic copper chaperone A
MPRLVNMRRPAVGALVAVALTAAAVLIPVSPAAAHVTVSAAGAAPGGYTRVAFRVPNESASASTTKLEVFLPEGQPIRSVSTMPVPGWAVKLVRRTLDTPIVTDSGEEVTEVVARITWTADARSAVGPGQFQEFPVSLGPLPEADQLVFKALQTYSDGSVVRWIDEPTADGAEPEHPAPVLKLTAPAAAPAPGAATDTPDTRDPLALWLAVAALVTGLAGLALGAAALARARTAPASTA